MTQKDTLDDLRARSKAARDSSRQAMNEASGHEKTLSETLDRSADNHERAEAQKADWPKTPEP
jgi:hypothetical protein